MAELADQAELPSGLAARPVIDMLALVRSLTEARGAVRPLAGSPDSFAIIATPRPAPRPSSSPACSAMPAWICQPAVACRNSPRSLPIDGRAGVGLNDGHGHAAGSE